VKISQTTAGLSLFKDIFHVIIQSLDNGVSRIQQVGTRVSFDVHTTRLVTGALPLQGRGSGTLPAELQQNVALSDNLNGV